MKRRKLLLTGARSGCSEACDMFLCKLCRMISWAELLTTSPALF